MTDAPTAGPRRFMPVLLGLLTSGLVILALPTFEIAAIGLFAWAPLLVAIQADRHSSAQKMSALSRRQRFWLGLLTGFVYQLVLFRWIPFTLTEMTPFPAALTWLMVTLYALWHGLQIALFCAWLPSVTRLVSTRFPALVPVVTALFFAFVEWAFPALFPWSYGHTIWELGPIAAPLLSFQGVPLMTFWVLLPSALIAGLVVRPSPRRAMLLVTLGTLVLTLAVPALVRELTLETSPASNDRLRVAVVQPNFTLAEKKKATRQTRLRLLDRLEAQLRALPPGELDLIVGSEGAFPLWWQLDAGPLPTDPASPSPSRKPDPLLEGTRRVQRAIAEGPRAHTILGGLRYDEDGETRNAAVHLAPDGQIRGHYDKQTLVPFSEYVPFADLIPSLKEIPGIGHMIPGDRPCAFDADPPGRAPLPIACGICYESMFAGDTRRDVGDARLLVNLTIDTWFGTSTAPRMHLMSHASRAAELGVPLLRAGLTGLSAIIGPDGQVGSLQPLDTAGVLRADIALTTGTTVYRELGQVLMPLVGLLLLAAMLRAFWQRLRARRTIALAGPP